MNTTMIKASAEDVHTVVAELQPILTQHTREEAILACLSIAIGLQMPNITAGMLLEAVYGASQWIAAYMDVLNNPTFSIIPKEQVN